MKFSGIIAPLAVAGTASAAAIPVQSIEGALGELHTTLGTVQGLVGGLIGGTPAPAALNSLTTKLSSVETTLQGLSSCATGSGAGAITGTAGNLVSTGESTVSGVASTAEGQVQGVTGGVVGGFSVGSIETVVTSTFSKIQSGQISPEMIMSALNVPEIRGLLNGPLSQLHSIEAPAASLETFVTGAVSKIQSGQLTPEMVLGTLNFSVLQGLLGGVLGNVL